MPTDMKPKTKNPASVQLELFTVEPRPMKRASWPTPGGSCSRLRGAVVDAKKLAYCSLSVSDEGQNNRTIEKRGIGSVHQLFLSRCTGDALIPNA